MKLVWCPDTASKAYIDTVRSVSSSTSNQNLSLPFTATKTTTTTTMTTGFQHYSGDDLLMEEEEEEEEEDRSVAELISAMAGGWNPQLIVETWSRRSPIATSIGLSVASRHTGGRHVCVVPEHGSRAAYKDAMGVQEEGAPPEVVVGEAEEVMALAGLVGIDFLVLDSKRKEYCARVLKLARFSPRGAVLVCKNAAAGGGALRWRRVVVESGARVVRSAYLPVGGGVEIAHVGASGGGGGSSKGRSKWIRHVDEAGEEHLFRR